MVKPGKYVWRNNDHDQIVEVEGVLGEGSDGKIYLKIKESTAGVPLDQCTPVKNISKSTKPANSRLF
jgi:hypothetical protein